MKERVYNFSPGPATLPLEVLQQAGRDIVNYKGTGMGLVELSHRSEEFMAITDATETLLRKHLALPKNYRVLFLQGGASTQFYMIPMNFLTTGKCGAYLNTGTWSKKAIKEAAQLGDIEVVFSSEPETFNRVPRQGEYQVPEHADYLYFVSNNTIFGTQFKSMPVTEKPLFCDMSSDILSRKFTVTDFGLIFAGAQKNLGPAGVTIVIIEESLLAQIPEGLPTMINYNTHVEKGSMFNTPPCFAIYLVGEVLKWLDRAGGVTAIEKINRDKAALLYEMIDDSDYYRGHAQADSRSDMNVTFNLASAELERTFITEAAEVGLKGLKGHRSIGGCRASIYNAFPRSGVVKLVDFMNTFRAKNPA